jgi:hypothetical protein
MHAVMNSVDCLISSQMSALFLKFGQQLPHLR